MDSITALQRQRNQSRSLVAEKTITASQTNSCGTVTVTADNGGDNGGDNGDNDDGGGTTSPVESGIGTTSIAVAGGIGLLGVLLLLLN